MKSIVRSIYLKNSLIIIVSLSFISLFESKADDEILKKLGYGDDRLRSLRENKTI